MDNVASLADLRDIHMPPPVGIWPLAPGWYGVIILAILALAGVLIGLYYRYPHLLVKRQAQRLLKQYKQDFWVSKNTDEACSKVSSLLKRVAIAYFPRSEVAGLQGQAWLNFLNSTASNIDFKAVETQLLLAPYQNRNQDHDMELFFNYAEAWIKQRGKLCLS